LQLLFFYAIFHSSYTSIQPAKGFVFSPAKTPANMLFLLLNRTGYAKTSAFFYGIFRPVFTV
jgi:hypothetical protein